MVRQWDVLGLGSATVDEFLVVDRFPVQDSKQEVVSVDRQGGGLIATACVAAARLGARVGYCDVLGDDDLSRWVIDDLEREGVDTSPVIRRAHASPIRPVIIVAPGGSRTILYTAGGRDRRPEDHPSEAQIRAAGVLLIDCLTQPATLRAAQMARAAGVPLVADFERDLLPDLLAIADHLILSDTFAAHLTGQPDPARAALALWHPGRAVVIVTIGAQGCWVVDAAEQPLHFPAFAVRAVDTTGCGDAFHGAYALALGEGMPLAERVRFASAVAALKATQLGGRRGIPTRAQVSAFLREAG